MTNSETIVESAPSSHRDAGKRRAKIWGGTALGLVLLLGIGHYGSELLFPTAAPAASAPPSVAVSTPIKRDLDTRLQFTGQFAALKQVELRAQVGGTLTRILFKDGDIVRQGQVLFEIDSEPYRIKYAQANAELESANARLHLATQELTRAQTLKSTDAGSSQNVDQKAAERSAAQAAVSGAQAMIRDARFDLDRARIRAPFTGRIGTHLVSAGNLVSGSRAGSGATTLLTTLVSIDPIYLNFDMSESDYMAFARQREKQKGPLASQVEISLADETVFDRKGTLDFVDNTLERSSGTIHARATVPNSDFLLTPGGFARVRLALSTPVPLLLVPDAAVLPDQSDHVVLTIGKDNVVTPKKVELGDLRGGLRVIRSGLASTDRVIIDGIPTAAPGSKVSPHAGAIHFASDQD